MDDALKEQIEGHINSNDVFLFMKGNPSFPQCGFSARVADILKQFQAEYGHFDVLSDQSVREGIKAYSDWPTIPQLYVKGEFIGGCDIVMELYQSGELKSLLASGTVSDDNTPADA